MLLVGMPAIPRGVDWTTIWYKELSVRAAYAYGIENRGGRWCSTFDWSLELLAQCGDALRPLLGSPFALQDYRTALQTTLRPGVTHAVKTLFRI